MPIISFKKFENLSVYAISVYFEIILKFKKIFIKNVFITILIAYDLLRTLSGHGSEVYSVAFDNNDILASASADKTIKLWDKNTGYLLTTLSAPCNYVCYIR